jgi:hypothetical protein
VFGKNNVSSFFCFLCISSIASNAILAAKDGGGAGVRRPTPYERPAGQLNARGAPGVTHAKGASELLKHGSTSAFLPWRQALTAIAGGVGHGSVGSASPIAAPSSVAPVVSESLPMPQDEHKVPASAVSSIAAVGAGGGDTRFSVPKSPHPILAEIARGAMTAKPALPDGKGRNPQMIITRVKAEILACERAILDNKSFAVLSMGRKEPLGTMMGLVANSIFRAYQSADTLPDATKQKFYASNPSADEIFGNHIAALFFLMGSSPLEADVWGLKRKWAGEIVEYVTTGRRPYWLKKEDPREEDPRLKKSLLETFIRFEGKFKKLLTSEHYEAMMKKSRKREEEKMSGK